MELDSNLDLSGSEATLLRVKLYIAKSCIRTVSSCTFTKAQLTKYLPRILPYKLLYLGQSWRIDFRVTSPVNSSLSSPKCYQFWEKGGMEFFTHTREPFSGVEMGPLFDSIHWFMWTFLPLLRWVLSGNLNSWSILWNFVSKKAKLPIEVLGLGCKGFSGMRGRPDLPISMDQATLPMF